MIETTVPLDTTKASKYFLIDQLVKFFLPLGQSKKIFETFVTLNRQHPESFTSRVFLFFLNTGNIFRIAQKVQKNSKRI